MSSTMRFDTWQDSNGNPVATGSGGVFNATISQSMLATPLNASGSAPLYSVRAWANLNCSSSPSIRASGNVSSITRQATGHFTVNFSTAMSDANYSIGLSARDTTGDGAGDGTIWVRGTTTPGTSSFQITTGAVRGIVAPQDNSFAYMAVYR